MAHSGYGVLEQFESLRGEVRVLKGLPGDVPAGTSQALDETERHRLVHDGHYDGNRHARLLRSADCLRTPRDKHIDRERDELGRDFRKLVEPALAPSRLDHDGLPLDPPKLAESIAERIDQQLELITPAAGAGS